MAPGRSQDDILQGVRPVVMKCDKATEVNRTYLDRQFVREVERVIREEMG